MKDVLKIGGILLAITVIAAAALSGVYSVTKPLIEDAKQKEQDAALTVALAGADTSGIYKVENEEYVYYEGFTERERQNLIGYAFITSKYGYSSDIVTMVGVDTAGTIIGIKVLSQQETPGLGTRIAEKAYGETKTWVQKQFEGKTAMGCAVDKDGGSIISITGATISSRAVTNSVVDGYKKFNEFITKK
ncbi:RnfABCDGE type electron transport complex subunit G [candidate division KSB1 bacterium]|nr:RnfABCDGE type electron transport complex subunit G [candidate division KSB1 bacterium]